MRKLLAVLTAVAFLFAAPAIPQKQHDNDFLVYVVAQGTAEPIGRALKKRLNVSKPFAVATKDDVSKAVVLVSCMDHDKEGLPYACMYVLSLNGSAFKTFMGGGLYLAMTPDDMASNFLKSIAQDIVERFENTNKENLRDALKSCLFLTDTKCNVPTPLQQEFGEKQLTLGQFMMKSQIKTWAAQFPTGRRLSSAS
jgi:hypothetical protein